MDKLEAARAMRNLLPAVRDQLIKAADNVLDLRPTLRHKAKQRALTAYYRRSFLPRSPVA